jgi:hypothetical protein
MMKKLQLRIITTIFATLFLGSFVFTSCEGPEGPMGPAGTDGTDGVDGVDGNITCMACHNVDVKNQITAQFARSQHASGAIAVDYAGGRASCAQCHSHDGFLEWAWNGEVAENIADPKAWECSTCHALHQTMDSTDYAFRVSGAVTLLDESGAVVDEGNNNLCVNCHQARRGRDSYEGTADETYERTFTGADAAHYAETPSIGPNGSITVNATQDTVVVVFDVPVATHTYINSTHAGPHHGPQGNLWAGLGGTETGDMYGPHSAGCVGCHMGDNSNHSFWPLDENCDACHGSKESEMDAIADRIHAVGEALEDLHAVHYDDEDGAYHPMYASLTKDQFDAFWNFMYVLEDRSNGAHNPTYIKALLTKCETVLGI